METKVCTICQQGKPLDQYRKYSGRGRLGLRPLCKICQRAYEAKWRSQSKEKLKDSRARGADQRAAYSREWRAKNRAFYLISETRRRAVKKGIPFDLDHHIEALQARISAGVCEVSGVRLDLSTEPGRRFNAPSLDRRDPRQGYVIANVRVVAFAVNAMLGDWGEEIALSIAREWLEKVG